MKVFFVMVLVMVAGSFPSHGRTESEGTVFNNTLPHGSMNNVTVSSSKLVNYPYLFLAMQWPRSYCNFLNTEDRQCYLPVPDHFTVHGLWPQIPGQRLDCRDTRRYGLYYRFYDWNQLRLNEGLVNNLNKYWRDLTAPEGYSQSFWATEYNKHGSCTFNNPALYFSRTVNLVQNFVHIDLVARLSQLSRLPAGQSIIPGNTYSSTQIKDAVIRVTGIIPNLHCVQIGSDFQLLEIRFCANYGSYILSSCSFRSNCGNSVLLPNRP